MQFAPVGRQHIRRWIASVRDLQIVERYVMSQQRQARFADRHFRSKKRFASANRVRSDGEIQPKLSSQHEHAGQKKTRQPGLPAKLISHAAAPNRTSGSTSTWISACRVNIDRVTEKNSRESQNAG